MVTVSPGAPMVGVTVRMFGVITVNGTELEARPFCCTRALPDCALEATVATICVSAQLTTVAGAVPSHTEPVPRVAPKYEPPMVTCVPPVAVVGDTLPIEGTAITVKGRALLVPALVVTVTLRAPGTAEGSMVKRAVICVALVTITALTDVPVPLTATIAPAAKLVPVRVSHGLAPCPALAGLTDVSTGAGGFTVNAAVPLVPPLVVTVTLAAPNAALAAIVSVAVI